ncbi:MAG: tetratricopeptide repeat protein [Anaerolineae bacterium]|nr:tetratricopeptide repeat protein [Anaerolineae bacterium]
MAIPLLVTKLTIPPLRPQRVRRPRLTHALTKGFEPNCLLTLVCAPAGYGKTTLLRDWWETLAEQRLDDGAPAPHCVWLTLDQGDDDLACFLNYLVAALQKVRPGMKGGLLTALQTPRPGSVQTLATLLINDLVETETTGRIVLVLDDYHLITTPSIHDFLSFLVEHQPPHLCVIIASRADPSLPLARWRARGQLVEIRQEDLLFTHEESAEFFGEMLDIYLSPAHLTALERRTEGWGAGLHLAALSMRHLTDVEAFIRTFSGAHEHIADYLTDEVLAQQPEAVVAFLLQTSILDSLTAPLCEAVTGQTGAQAMLSYLMEANLFLIPLDQQQTWYRYHTLFADLLRKRLFTSQRAQVEALHRRASHWYEENGFLSPAIDHALAGEDFERAAALIESTAEDRLARGETATLLRWLEALPPASKDAHLSLWIFHGLALILYGKPDTPVRDALDRLSGSVAVNSVQGETALLQALGTIMTGQTAEAISLTEKALQHLPSDSLFFRSLAADSLGMAHTLRGETAAAIAAFTQVVELATRTGAGMLSVMGLSSLAGLHYTQGQLRVAARMYQNVIDLANERLGKNSIYTGRARLGLGELAREWNDLDAALRYFDDAVTAMEQFSETGLTVCYLSIARVKLSQHAWDAAQDYIAQAQRHARESTASPFDDLLVGITQARYWVLHGDADLALEWARSQGLLERPVAEVLAGRGPTAAIDELMHGQYLLLARVFLALGQPDKALQIIEPLSSNALKAGHNRRGIEYLVLKALALQQKQDIARAVAVIGEALRLGEAEGFQRVFLDEGKPMAHLLYQAAEQGHYPAYTGKLLAGFSPAELTEPGQASKTNSDESLIEPLSDRENEVLALLAAGLSNKEIAGRLYISLSTTKWHIANIFGKLGVKSRTQAVSRARDFGLLPDR